MAAVKTQKMTGEAPINPYIESDAEASAQQIRPRFEMASSARTGEEKVRLAIVLPYGNRVNALSRALEWGLSWFNLPLQGGAISP